MKAYAARLLLILLAICMRSCAFSQDRCSRTQSSQLSSSSGDTPSDRYLGLNEDGDFLMVGINGNDSVDESDDRIILESTQEWLLGIVPTLPPGELIYYAQKLVNIGFDPVCVSQRKLKLEDLSFMKAWHRRSFLKEATGKDNTF